MLIHCNELKPVRFGKYMIDAQKHITHHKERTKHYAAPIFDLEEILDTHPIPPNILLWEIQNTDPLIDRVLH